MCEHRGARVNLQIHEELRALVEQERKLDELIQSCRRQVLQMCDDHHSQRYPLPVNSASFYSVFLAVRILFFVHKHQADYHP